MNKSNERNSFQKEMYLKRKLEEGKTPDNDEYVSEILEIFESEAFRKQKLEASEEFKKENLEYDLRSTKWICDKAKESEVYAQNLYAALCNNDFIQNNVWPLLKGKTWSCSWRYAGGIIADMVEHGDYIDWYCSGIRGQPLTANDEHDIFSNFVGEGIVTDEIREDLLKLGWIVVDTDDNL